MFEGRRSPIGGDFDAVCMHVFCACSKEILLRERGKRGGGYIHDNAPHVERRGKLVPSHLFDGRAKAEKERAPISLLQYNIAPVRRKKDEWCESARCWRKGILLLRLLRGFVWGRVLMSHLTPLLLLDKERRRFSLEKELSSNSFRKHPSLYSLSFAAMEDGGPTSLVGVGGVGVGAGSGDDGASTSAVHKLVYVVLKASVGEARGAEGEPVMLAASASLGAMASEVPMVVAQMWLEQFARINSGASPAEYATKERIVLLRNMENIVGKRGSTTSNR